MRPARSLALYLLWVFGGGALIAPIAYWGIQAAAKEAPILTRFADEPFHRYLNRSLLILALVGMWPLVRSFGMVSRESIGLWGAGKARRSLGVGFLLGLASLAAAGIAALLLGGRTINPEPGLAEWMRRLSSAFVSASVVAVLEEVLFRGAIFGAFQRAWSFRSSLILSSAIFAVVHFLERPASPAEVHWGSGFSTLAAMCAGFLEPWKLVPGLINLFLAGAVLAMAYRRTSSLYFPIGVHAGWIFWGKMYLFGTRSTAQGDFLMGGGRLFDGWLALIVLACVAPAVHVLTPSEVNGDWERTRAVDRERVEPMV